MKFHNLKATFDESALHNCRYRTKIKCKSHNTAKKEIEKESYMV